jgi:molybdenum cofactor cytidylyltransferase
MTHSSTAAIVLAAGASRRMGRNKMLVELDGQSLVRRAVRRVFEAGLDPIVVVVGHEEERVRTELTGFPCHFVTNRDYTGPTSTSLHLGLDALPAHVNSAIVILGDMPFVTSEMLRQMAAAAGSTSAPLVVSRYSDVLAPPLLFHRALFPELLAWHGEGCGKQVVLRHQAAAMILDWPAEALRDIDTPEELAAARNAQKT